jgi:hypothetical protein
LIANGGPLAAPATATQPFWQPSTTATTQATCDKTLAGGSLSSSMLLGRSAISVSASSEAPASLQLSGSQTTRSATFNAFHSPDMTTLVGCYAELQSAFEHSVDPTTDQSPPTTPTVETNYPTGALALSGSCG